MKKDRVPGGAILAHCMGLGKTLQTIGLVHTVMTAFPEKMHRTLILCPVNTIKNWDEEFVKWLKGPVADDFEVYEMSGDKDNYARADRLNFSARYISGNISLNNAISWGLAAPRTPHGFPRVLGPKKQFLENLIVAYLYIGL